MPTYDSTGAISNVAQRPATPSSPATAQARPGASRRSGGLLLAGGMLVAAGLLFFARPAAAPKPLFDKDRAFSDLKKQVDCGPRVPNTPGQAACREYFLKTLQPLADSVERQDFARAIRGQSLKMTNVIARWKGRSNGNGVLLCAHWDTRPTADYERTPAKRLTPIPGANDGASGAAVLLELARGLHQSPPPVPVMLVFFDGEDVGPSIEEMFLGSVYFADHLPNDVPRRGVLMDMIGDRDLEIPQEGHSLQEAQGVVDEIYATAKKLGYERSFPSRSGGPIEDDHLPLQRKGLKVIDLIDFNYGPGHSWWHTLADTPDKCSPESLKTVGDVLLEWTYTQR